MRERLPGQASTPTVAPAGKRNCPVPNATDQPTDRPKRGTLFVLVLAALVAVGLWYFLDRSKEPISPESTEATSDAAPATGDAGTTGVDAPPTADSGTAASEGNVQATEAGAAKPTDVAESTGAGAATQGEQPDAGATGTTPTTDPAATAQGRQPDAAGTDTAGATGTTPTPDPAATAEGRQPDAAGTDAASATGTTPTTDPAATAEGRQPDAAGTDAAGATGTTPTTDPAATAQGEQPGAVETDTAVAGATTQTAEPGTSAASETTRTAATDAGDPADATPPTDSDPTLDPRPSATAERGAAHSDGELVLAPAPEDPIEKTPVEAPSATETTGAADILATVDRAIERIESAIKERLGTESEADSDTDLDVHVTYDDRQGDVAKAETEPDVAATTTESGTPPPTRDSQAPESGVAAGTDKVEAPASDAQPPGSGVAAGTGITESTEPESAAPADATRTADSDSTETEAKAFVETLTDTAPDTIAVDKADHFVTQERVISLVPEDTIESVSVEELATDKALSSDTPITVVREVEQIEPAVPEQLIAEARGDLDTRLRVQVTYDDSEDEAQQSDSGQTAPDPPTVERITVREALDRIATEPKKPLSVVKTVRYFEVMTLRELLDNEQGDDAYLKVVTKPYRIESATLADLLRREKAENPDSVFYLHTVQPTDEQGIWGIVHFGLIENFAGGMAIRRGEEVGTYTVRIPRDADERLEDQSSSFLGKLIDRKTKDSFVYNYRDNRMGRNPDRIFPGQELVIIRFDPEELMAIYTHFATG